jgi:hypothetical protein
MCWRCSRIGSATELYRDSYATGNSITLIIRHSARLYRVPVRNLSLLIGSSGGSPNPPLVAQYFNSARQRFSLFFFFFSPCQHIPRFKQSLCAVSSSSISTASSARPLTLLRSFTFFQNNTTSHTDRYISKPPSWGESNFNTSIDPSSSRR